ncbi:glycosyltransferase [Flavobacterium sp. I3-2]|uniref:glycosyltransferase n=1 Tax=Flavobacterium sp. I3-2 TaxID=2748319 RepID=UPI0015A98DE3|nr:glycosyltransferase [Flavobacterium sp. I3-2]
MDKKKKIAIVVYTLKSGGLERVVSNQTFLFDALGFEIDLFVLENEIDFPFKGNLRCYDFNFSDGFLVKIKKYFKLNNDIQAGNFDFILDHRYRLNDLIESFWINKIYKNQHVFYFIHSSDVSSYLNSRLANNSKIKFISVSKGIENEVKRIYPKIEIQTIYNNVEVPKIEKEFKEIKENYIMSAGRMDESNVKQFDLLIDCYSKSILPSQNIKLLILGSGIRLKSLKEQVSKLNLQDLVIFKGFEINLYSYYKHAKYFVLSSKFEGLGMVLIESLLCKTPVISFDCDFGPNEIIQDKMNGLLVENQNTEKLIEAMNLFIENEELYTACKSNTLISIEQFSKENISKKWLSTFNDTH